MLIGSVANGLHPSDDFCAGSSIVVDYQRNNGTSFVFLAAVPALLAISSSEGINILRNTHPEHATEERARDSRGARPYRLAHDPLSRSLIDHPHSSTYRDAIVDCAGRESPYRGFARCTVVRHCGLGAPLAGHRGRGTRRACGSQGLGGCLLNRGQVFDSL